MRKAKRDIPVGRVWGKRRSTRIEPLKDEHDAVLKYRCDKLSDEIEERLRASAKVYTSETHSQDFLKSLVSSKSL